MKTFCFPKSLRLRKRRQYQRIAHQPVRCAGKWVVVDFRESRNSQTRLGITASRHYGKAVERNRFKRIVREAFRTCRHQLQQGLDINVKPRQSSRKAKMGDIISDLQAILALPLSVGTS